MPDYYRYNARLGSFAPMTEKEFERKIKSKWVLPVYDSYWQTSSDSTYYDCRDSIATIFYMRTEDDSV